MSGVRVEVVRGERVESVHEVAVAAVGAEGVLATAGDTEGVIFARSAVKPFQALPLVEDGVVARYGLTEEELALCCASHSGEPRHVEVAGSILGRIGLGEEALACGPHAPFSSAATSALAAEGREPGRIHNNCSGKHAGMLALALAHGWSIDGYQDRGHPVQQRMLAEVGRWTGLDPERIETAVDGCGVVTFGVSVTALATAFARLGGAPADSAAVRVLTAMRRHPFLVGGTNRLCTSLIEATDGRVVAKVGAEGVYGAVAVQAGVGVALKVRDGARRAAEVALLAVLRDLDLLTEPELERLQRWARPALENTRGERVGEIRAATELRAYRG